MIKTTNAVVGIKKLSPFLFWFISFLLISLSISSHAQLATPGSISDGYKSDRFANKSNIRYGNKYNAAVFRVDSNNSATATARFNESANWQCSSISNFLDDAHDIRNHKDTSFRRAVDSLWWRTVSGRKCGIGQLPDRLCQPHKLG